MIQRRISRTVPFGWKVTDDPNYIEEIPEQTSALQEAKWYMECGQTMQATRNWLVGTTGREITIPGMLKAIANVGRVKDTSKAPWTASAKDKNTALNALAEKALSAQRGSEET